MDILPHELVIQQILTRAPQLGLASKEFYKLLPKIAPDQKSNIKFPSVKNRNPIYIKNNNLQFEYEVRINFKKLDEMIEDNSVRELRISTKSPIFLEMKRMFKIILKNTVSIMDGWKYKSTFIQVDESHYDAHKYRKAQFLQLEWMDSFVMSFIFYLYH
jgi:hypothetical protein